MDFIWLGLGIAIAGYLIGDGLKNFKNPDAANIFDSFDEDHELIKENDLHYFIGVSKEDAKHMIAEHPSIPHITINNNVYYPKRKLREWLKNIES
ncbi:hypothetical protein ATL39_2992 [Sinobaca qinghaiensis]|uniref:DNA-binding protein n=1 Tax=Sinobaca qinghaiensis TaxID=342944 RepID=A0A419UWQ1_9BACL|nr:DNA-binding protein [Sinobaca qinghaiensis]RKD69572.1 hypothetical protein ATL39_2992 [Sinobaca qinghaiensis]